MALIWMDSFDHYVSTSQKYDIGGTNTTTTLSRNGPRSFPFGTGGTSQILKNIPSTATIISGFAWYMQYPSSTQAGIWAFLDGGTFQVELRVDNTGKFYFTRNGTQIGSKTAASYSVNAWHYMEVKVTVHGSAGEASLHVDGVAVLTQTGLNAQNTGNASGNQLQLGNIGTFGLPSYADDYYILDTTGPAPWNTFLGDVAVVALLPSGNGSTQNYTTAWASFQNSHNYALGEQFKDSNNNVQQCTVPGTSAGAGTPTWATNGGSTTTSGGASFVVVGTGSNPGAQNWMAVSEIGPDDDGSYVTDATVNDKELFTYPALPGSTSSVYAVGVNSRAEKDDAGTRAIRSLVESGATTMDNGADHGLTQSSYQNFQDIFVNDPNTSSQWTATGVNGAEFGVKTTA